jgi:type IV pilus assembly protein PilO
MSMTRKWSLLTALLIVAVFVASWFLLIAPKRSEAADLKAQAQSKSDANAALVQKLAQLKAQEAELPAQRAKLAVFRTQIPDNPALPSLVRDLTAAARKVGASLDEMTPQPPTALVDPTAPVTATTGTGAAPTAQLFGIPMAMKVSGGYFELEQFVSKLEGLKRSFLVTGFTVKPSEETDALPDTLTIEIQGQVFLAPAPATTAAASTPVTATSK